MRQLSPQEVGALAKNVRRHRRALGLRLAEMADYLGVSAVYLTGLELGAIGRPFPEPLDRLARLLDLADWTELLEYPAEDDGGRHGARWAGQSDMPTAAAAERFIRQQWRGQG